MSLLLFILALMVSLDPRGSDKHGALALGIESAIKAEGCIFNGTDCERRSAAMAVAIAYRESGFRVDVVGDHGRSMCAFQILGGSRALLADADACALAGYRRIKESFRSCRGSLAGYAAGSCNSVQGARIDRDRKALAKRTFDKVKL